MSSRRLIAVLLASILIANPVLAAAPVSSGKAPATKSAPATSTKKAKADEQPQAKIAPLWGLLFAAIKSSVFSAFSDWLSQKVFGGMPIPNAPPPGGVVPFAFLPQPQQIFGGQPPGYGMPQPGYPPAANPWQPQVAQAAQAYPGQQPGYPAAPPAADPWAQQQAQAMPAQQPGYPAAPPPEQWQQQQAAQAAQPYPGQQPGYPAPPPAADPWAQQAMAGQQPGMPAQQPGYPAAPPAADPWQQPQQATQPYPGQQPGYPAASPAADPWAQQQAQAMPAQQPGYPGAPAAQPYPGQQPGYPATPPAADPWQQVLQSPPSANAQQPYPGQPAQPLTLGQYKKNLKADLTNTAIQKVTTVAAGQMTKLLDSLFAAKSAPVLGQPNAALKVRDGNPNYQALHVAIVAVDKDGRPVGLRPVSEGFRTGERIKLRVVSTFDGAMTIANINPNDERRQIYPAKKDEVITVRAGQQMLLPLGADEFFEFRGAKGTEQLVLTLVDPRALAGGKPSGETVHRQDAWYGSNFAQAVSADSYPVITQTISLLHH